MYVVDTTRTAAHTGRCTHLFLQTMKTMQPTMLATMTLMRTIATVFAPGLCSTTGYQTNN